MLLCQATQQSYFLLQEVTTWDEMGIHGGDVTWIQNLKAGTKTECSKVQITLLEVSLEQKSKPTIKIYKSEEL